MAIKVRLLFVTLKVVSKLQFQQQLQFQKFSELQALSQSFLVEHHKHIKDPQLMSTTIIYDINKTLQKIISYVRYMPILCSDMNVCIYILFILRTCKYALARTHTFLIYMSIYACVVCICPSGKVRLSILSQSRNMSRLH